MDKQKAADEMFDLLYKNRSKLQDNRNGNGQYSLFSISTTLANEGYRKAEEVRKETARNISDWLEYRAKNSGYGDSIELQIMCLAKIIKETYGMEVNNG